MTTGFLKIAVLKELSRKNFSGYELMKKIHEITNKKPSPGSIYPLLSELAKEKYITCYKKGKSKIYSITEKGKKKVLALCKDKKELIKRHIELLDSLGEIRSKKDLKMMEEFFSYFCSYHNQLLIENLPLVLELRKTLLKIAKSNTLNDEKKEKIKSILKETIIKLKKVLKKSN